MRPSIVHNVIYSDVERQQHPAIICAVHERAFPPVSPTHEEDRYNVHLAIIPCDDAHPDAPGSDPEPFDPTDKTNFVGVPVVITQRPVPFSPAPGTPGTWTWPPRV
jgi:hypothetical protein